MERINKAEKNEDAPSHIFWVSERHLLMTSRMCPRKSLHLNNPREQGPTRGWRRKLYHAPMNHAPMTHLKLKTLKTALTKIVTRVLMAWRLRIFSRRQWAVARSKGNLLLGCRISKHLNTWLQKKSTSDLLLPNHPPPIQCSPEKTCSNQKPRPFSEDPKDERLIEKIITLVANALLLLVVPLRQNGATQVSTVL